MTAREEAAAQPAPAPPTKPTTPPGLGGLVCAICLRHTDPLSPKPVEAAVTIVNGASLCAEHTRSAPRSALPYGDEES